MRYLQIKKHFADCAVAYFTMSCVLLLGVSSGIWFLLLSSSECLSLAMLGMYRSVSVNFWECFFSQMWFVVAVFLLTALSACSKYTALLGYLSLFAIGVAMGSGVCEGFSFGILQGISVVFFCLAVATVLIYFNVVHYCFRNSRRLSLPGYKGGNKQARITASCILAVVMMNALWSYVTVLINRSV